MIHGQHDEMSVADTEPMDDHAYPLGTQCPAHGASEPMTEQEDVRSKILREIGEVVHVLSRYHERLTRADWSDVHERHDTLILEDDARGHPAGEDRAEDAAHVTDPILEE